MRSGVLRTGSMIALTAALAVAGLTGCKKDSEKLTWQETGRPPVVEQNKQKAASLKAPPMFAHIPADTPYVFAAFEPIPAAYWSHVCEKLCPVWEKAFSQLSDATGTIDDPAARIVSAVLSELSGNMSSEGLHKLGISTDPVFAVYGLGPMPVVRIEVADPAALTATLNRIVAKVGAELPTQRVGDQEYWLAADGAFAAGIVGKELVATLGPPRAVQLAIPVLFGGASLSKTMADGAQLKKLAAEYGFASYGLGYVDLRRFAELATGTETSLHQQIFDTYRGALGLRGRAQRPLEQNPPADHDAVLAAPPAEEEMVPPDPDGPQGGGFAGVAVRAPEPIPAGLDGPKCRADLMELTQDVPRLVLGYDEISTKRAIFTAVLETDAAIAQRVQSLETRVPGMSGRLPGSPMFAMGAAIQVDKARHLADAMGRRFSEIGGNCDLDGWIEFGHGLQQMLDLPLPPSMESLRGGFLVVQNMKMSLSGPPSNMSGYAIVGVSNAPAVLRDLAGAIPILSSVKGDGKFHKVSAGPFSQFVSTLRLAAKPDALVVTAGDSANAIAKQVLSAKHDRSPLLMFAEDVGKVNQLTSSLFDQVGGSDPSMAALGAAMRAQNNVFGLAVFSVHAGKNGVEMIGRIDLK